MDVPLFYRSITADTESVEAPQPTASSKSWWARLVDGFSSRDLLGPVLGPLLLMPFAIAFVGVVVAPVPGLKADFPLMLATVIFSQAISTLVYCALSQFRTCTNIDLLSAAFLAQLCTAFRSSGISEPDMFVHLCAGQGAFTLLVGILLCVLAWLDGMWYLRFMPYTVSAGYVTGIGLLILDGGFKLGCGHGMKELFMSVTALPVMTFVHVGTAAFAVVVLYAVSHVIRSGLRLPVGLAVVTLLFHGTAYLAGLTGDEVKSMGFLVDGLAPESWTEEWLEIRERFSGLQSRAFFQMPVLSLTASYAVLHVINYSFYAAAMREIDKSSAGRKFSMQQEIRLMGTTNILVGCLAGVPVSHCIPALVVMQGAGARSKIWSLLVGILFFTLYFWTDLRVGLAVIPKCAFGGLVGLLGLEFAVVSLVEARERIAPAECRFVLMIAVVTYFNVLMGLAFGLGLVAIFFIVEYSGLAGITHHATLQEVHSQVDRPSDEICLLESFGGEGVVYWLTGYIFFGIAVGVVEEVEAFIDCTPSVRSIIIDFEHVPAVDASGVHHFTDFASKCLMRQPPIRACFSGAVRRLRLALANAAKSKGLVGLKLDAHLAEDAILWAEERVMARHGKSARERSAPQASTKGSEVASPLELLKVCLGSMAPKQPPASLASAAARLAPSAQVFIASEGMHLFTEGSSATTLFYIAHGRVELTRARRADEGCKLPRHHLNKDKGDVFVFEERRSTRVQLASAGSLLGASEYVLAAGAAKACWSTSAKATADCSVLKVPFSDFAAAIEERPALGLEIANRMAQLSSSHLLRLMSRSEPTAFSTV